MARTEPFALTAAQQTAMALIARPEADEFMTFGGSRSGKTFMYLRAMVLRALRAPGSRHLAARFRRNAAMATIARQTLPAVMTKCFPQIRWELNKSEGIAEFPGTGSEIWIAGLDDEARIEKILGSEFATLLFNECSQIAWKARNTVMTRLAQNVIDTAGPSPRQLRLRAWYDENPPNKAHWTYRYFIQKLDPETRVALAHDHAQRVGAYSINPADNRENLPAAYFETLAKLPARFRSRFELGLFADDNPNALFPEEDIDRWRLDSEFDSLPDLQRIVIAVDPSGAGDDAEATEHDAIGIVVMGLGTDGNGYVLEDLTVSGGPLLWGKTVAAAHQRHGADLVVGEVNYGGAMVGHVIRTAKMPDGSQNRIAFKSITASRGKALRAEPISPLVCDGRIRFVGRHLKLEDEIAGMTTHGYTGDRSPNRADAFVFAASELFGGIVKPRNTGDRAARHRHGLYSPTGETVGAPGAWM